MKQRRLTLATALALAVPLASLTACGGGSTSATDGPIRIMVESGITPSAATGGLSFPTPGYGAQAAAKAINAAGGIKGRQVKIDVCDNKFDPNVSAQCARSAKSNGDVAVIGSDTFGAPAILPVLQAEKIPYFGSPPTSAAEMTSPVAFQFNPGSILSSFATAQLWVDAGCTKVASLNAPTPGVDQVIAGQQAVLKGTDVTVTNLTLALNGSNLSAVVSSAVGQKPDCLTIEGPGSVDVAVITGARKIGYTGKVITSVGSLPASLVPTLGAAGEGLLALNAVQLPDSSDPLVAKFVSQLTAFFDGDKGKAMKNADEYSQTAWSAVQVIAQALGKASSGDDTAAYLLTTLPTMCDVDPGGVYPHVNFCKPVSKAFPRVFNDSWQYDVVKDGAYVAQDDTWHDLSSTIPE